MDRDHSVPPGVDIDEVIAALRAAGARFAFVFGSRARSEGPSQPERPESDLDVGAWWGDDPPDPWTVSLPSVVDLVVLDTAPLFLAGRVALWGVPLFDDDPPARVHWPADTRKRYLDESPVGSRPTPISPHRSEMVEVERVRRHRRPSTSARPSMGHAHHECRCVRPPRPARRHRAGPGGTAGRLGGLPQRAREYAVVDDDRVVAALGELGDLRAFIRAIEGLLADQY